MIREYGQGTSEAPDGCAELVRGFLQHGPQRYIDNAQVDMRLLEIDGHMLPLVIANPDAANGDLCSPYAHYLDYTREEFGKRHPRLPSWLVHALFGTWAVPIRRNSLDRVVYVNNWLLSTNPPARLGRKQLDSLTGYLRQHFPGNAIVFRSLNQRLDHDLIANLRAIGYRLVPARTIYLLDPLPADSSLWKENIHRDLALLRNGGLRFERLKDRSGVDPDHIAHLYRNLYLGKHSHLNPQYNRHFFEQALAGDWLDALFVSDADRVVACVLFLETGRLLLPLVIGYDLTYPRASGIYRQAIAWLMIEAQSRGTLLHLSAGAGRFKMYRGAVPVVEYEAVLTRGLSWQQRVAWSQLQLQGRLWAGKHSSGRNDAGDRGEADHWEAAAAEYGDHGGQPLWRRCSDAVYRQLLQDQLEGNFDRMLKTDLWDEAYGGGLLTAPGTTAREVVAVDIAASTVQRAARTGQAVRVAVADVRKLPFPDGSFDLVLSNSTLDHFVNRSELRRALVELVRVLRPGGTLFITLDNPANPVIRLRQLLPQHWLRRTRILPYEMGATLTPGKLRATLESLGLEVERLGATVHAPRILMVGLAALLQRHASTRRQDRLVAWQLKFERMATWPTRFLTGYYTVARARKPKAAASDRDPRAVSSPRRG